MLSLRIRKIRRIRLRLTPRIAGIASPLSTLLVPFLLIVIRRALIR